MPRMHRYLPPAKKERVGQNLATGTKRSKEAAYQIGIPHSDCTFDTDLSHQETVHPAECKLHVFNALLVHMSCKRAFGMLCI